MKKLLLLLGAAALIAGGVALVNTTATQAADHGDPPAISANVKADINDTFAWIDDGHLAVAITVERAAASGAAFSQAVQYAFHVNRAGDGTGGGQDTEVICTFDSNDNTAVSCFIGQAGDFLVVRGDPSGATGFTDQGVSVFAGLRNDPFFFNLTGFAATATIVNTNAGALTLDANGCPDTSVAALAGSFATLGEALLNCLTTECEMFGGANNGVAVDDFAGENVLALVLRIPLDELNGNGDNIAVHASTHTAP